MPYSIDQTKTILLVDDNVVLAGLMQDVLEDMGYDVLVAHDGHQAETLVDAGNEVDLLLSDIRLEGSVDGFEVARRVRRTLPEVPILFISGDAGHSKDDMEAMKAPILQKPVFPDELGAAISEVMDVAQTSSDVREN